MSSRYFHHLLLVVTATAGIGVSCKSANSSRLANTGDPVDSYSADIQKKLEAVVALDVPARQEGKRSTCTGTFVIAKPPTILTALHCVKDAQQVVYALLPDGSKIQSSKILTPLDKKWPTAERIKNDDDVWRYDMALVVLSTDESYSVPTPLPFAKTDPKEVMLVGFGASNIDFIFTKGADPKAGTKRVGLNDVNRRTADGSFFIIEGKWRNDDTSSTRGDGIGPGDSGSPLLVEEAGIIAIAGVGSSMTWAEEINADVNIPIENLKPKDFAKSPVIGRYVNVSSPSIADFLKKNLAGVFQGGGGAPPPATPKEGACLAYVGKSLEACGCVQTSADLCKNYQDSPNLFPAGNCKPSPTTVRFLPGDRCATEGSKAVEPIDLEQEYPVE